MQPALSASSSPDGAYFHTPIALAAAAFLYDRLDLTVPYHLYRTSQVARGVLEDPACALASLGMGMVAHHLAGKSLEGPAWVVLTLTRAVEILGAQRRAAAAFERFIDAVVEAEVAETVAFPWGDCGVHVAFGGLWLKDHLAPSKVAWLNDKVAPWVQKVVAVVAASFSYLAHMATLTVAYIGLLDALANREYVQKEMTPLLFYHLLELYRKGPDELQLTLLDAEELLESLGLYWDLQWVYMALDGGSVLADTAADVVNDGAFTLSEPVRAVGALASNVFSLFFDPLTHVS